MKRFLRDSLAIFYFVRALWPNKSYNMQYIMIRLCRSQSYKSRELYKSKCVCSPRICNFWCLFCVISLALKSAFSSLFTQKIPALTSVYVPFWTPFTYTGFNVCVCVCVSFKKEGMLSLSLRRGKAGLPVAYGDRVGVPQACLDKLTDLREAHNTLHLFSC